MKLKERWAVYLKARGEWHCISLQVDRETAFKIMRDEGNKDKKLERLAVVDEVVLERRRTKK